MNVAARVDPDSVVFPNRVHGGQKPVAPDARNEADVPITGVGGHVPGLTGSAYGGVVRRGAVVRERSDRPVAKPVPKALALECLLLRISTERHGHRGAVFARPFCAGKVGAHKTVSPAEPLEGSRSTRQPPIRVLPHVAKRVKLALLAGELSHS